MIRLGKTVFTCCILSLGCGIANSGTAAGSTETPTTYNIVAAFQNMQLRGQTVSMNVSGDCNGKLTVQHTPASASTVVIDGKPTFSSTESTVLTLQDCSENSSLSMGAISSVAKVHYFDANHHPIGIERVGKDFGIFIAASGIPRLVKVGDSGAIGSINFFDDSRRRGTPDRREDMSYVVEPGRDGNVIINIVTKYYDTFFYPASALEATEQSRYVLTATGTMTRLSIDMQYRFPPRHIVSQ